MSERLMNKLKVKKTPIKRQRVKVKLAKDTSVLENVASKLKEFTDPTKEVAQASKEITETVDAALKLEPIDEDTTETGIDAKDTDAKDAETDDLPSLNVTIKDKRKDYKVDRNAFISKLSRVVESTTSGPSSQKLKPLTAASTPSLVQVPAAQQPAQLPDADADAQEKKTVKKKLKLRKRLKLKKTVASEAEQAQTQESKAIRSTLPPSKVTKARPVSNKTKLPIGIPIEGPASMLEIQGETIEKRLGKAKKDTRVKANAYYLANREIFVNFITSLFGKYKKDLNEAAEKATCERDDSMVFEPMAHQKIVRDYISLYTPYRGLLLYHGLGSGKTCSSIAIAEGLKTLKQVIVMTPASLRTNYIEELKKCGDSLYTKNQYWDFIPSESENIVAAISSILNLPMEFIRKQGGAWVMNIQKTSNFESLDSEQKKSLDLQLNKMIEQKYQFINYNGLRMSHLKTLTNNFKTNPFDNAVIIIDEAHNFVSRIVNKLRRPESLSMKLYEYLMNASNARVVALTGTPMINYPNELGVLFNILRGTIKTWSFKLNTDKQKRVTEETFKELFTSQSKGGNIMDLIEYKPSTTTLRVTRNPFGFVNKVRAKRYDGVRLADRGDMTDAEFEDSIKRLLAKIKISIIPSGIKVSQFKALPDGLEEFQNLFIDDTDDVKNMNLFKRRILGLASYFKDMDKLMPSYKKTTDFHVIKIPMSDFQFSIYEEARVQERKVELRNATKRKKKKDDLFEDTVSTYRIFSRAFCNFVFPRPDIRRPLPGDNANLENVIMKENVDEDTLDATSVKEKLLNVDGKYTLDDADELEETKLDEGTYDDKVKAALKELSKKKMDYLVPDKLKIYSPKFLKMIENITSSDNVGLNLIYSQFRTLEGIGIIKLVLEANGFAMLKLVKRDGQWLLDIKKGDEAKPRFALYTGTETVEEKELIRNIFNGTWEYLPFSLSTQLKSMAPNNLLGEIVKVLMITASGAEGISLRNVRYVHITEPYWHPVRLEQVIGRARRICSHQELPKDLQTVKVFLYLMEFSQKQIESDDSIELRLKDKSRIDKITPVTSDQHLYEIANAKADVAGKLLHAVKEASIDCSLHAKAGDTDAPVCFTFGSPDPTKFTYRPAITDEEEDDITMRNKKTVVLKGLKKITYDGISYAWNKETGDLYDFESYQRGNLVKVATLEQDGTGKTAKFRIVPI